MKRFLLYLLLTSLFAAAQSQEITCRYGFSYDISNSPNWGKNKPVITSVYPQSPAERAGIKPYDIIEEVEGVPVTENVLDDIHLFLNPEGKELVELTVKNITNGTRKVQIKKECKITYLLSESQMASAFSMYAVEHTHERLFSCPFVTTLTKDEVDFAEFQSFDFTNSDENQPEIARKINEYIKKELMNKGLKYDPVKPDLLVQIFYSRNKNPNFKPKQTTNPLKSDDLNEDNQFAYRYDITNDQMVKLPLLPSGTLESEAEYILKLGFRLEDRKLITGRVIWECEVNELMHEAFPIDEFAFLHIPLMSKQYPYYKYGRNVQFRLSRKKYNYTGVNFSIDRISEIVSVDPFSPAAKAGIQPFDRLDAINDKRMDRSSKQFTSAYHKFIINTLKYRDFRTRFKDANGFPDCMYWDTTKYELLAQEFENKKNLTAFSYLFNFEPFINPAGNNSCSIKLSRGKEKLEFIFRPEIRYEVTLVVE